MITFSGLNRENRLKEAIRNEVDLVVIGGGITGVGIALDAAMRGMQVVLVEKNDFGSGTSSKSTKLIHGGLRYLKQMDFKLVREVGRERAILSSNAPHLVKPEPMLLPVQTNGSLNAFTLRIALWTYELLAGVKREERMRILSKGETLRMEPTLIESRIKAGAVYTEYQTDDARLTVSVAKTAHAHGAVLLNYMAATEFVYSNGKISGLIVTDQLSTKKHTIKCKLCINAAGPWVDELREKDEAGFIRSLHLSKGVHIVVMRKHLPIKQAIYFDTSDKRMIFAIPHNDYVYIGTTDTSYKGSLDTIECTNEDITFLLNQVNSQFNSTKLHKNDIISSWAGLRPLISKPGKESKDLSRKDEIFISGNQLISIAGGKLTGFRVMAKKVVDLAAKKLAKNHNLHFSSCKTETALLSGGDLRGFESVEEYCEKLMGEAKQINLPYKRIWNLVNRYGSEADVIIEKAYDLWPKLELRDKLSEIAEIWYSIHHESSIVPADFYVRRTTQLYFPEIHILKWIENYSSHWMELSGLTDDDYKSHKYKLLSEFDRLSGTAGKTLNI